MNKMTKSVICNNVALFDCSICKGDEMEVTANDNGTMLFVIHDCLTDSTTSCNLSTADAERLATMIQTNLRKAVQS